LGFERGGKVIPIGGKIQSPENHSTIPKKGKNRDGEITLVEGRSLGEDPEPRAQREREKFGE